MDVEPFGVLASLENQPRQYCRPLFGVAALDDEIFDVSRRDLIRGTDEENSVLGWLSCISKHFKTCIVADQIKKGAK